MPVAPAPSETELASRLAARTLELIDVPSESHAEAALAEHVAGVLREGGAEVLDLGDSCILARPSEMRPRVLLAGHLDTVPPQDNIPGRVDSNRVHGIRSASTLTDRTVKTSASGSSDTMSAVAISCPLLSSAGRSELSAPLKRTS